jgi:hypothetical protein
MSVGAFVFMPFHQMDSFTRKKLPICFGPTCALITHYGSTKTSHRITCISNFFTLVCWLTARQGQSLPTVAEDQELRRNTTQRRQIWSPFMIILLVSISSLWLVIVLTAASTVTVGLSPFCRGVQVSRYNNTAFIYLFIVRKKLYLCSCGVGTTTVASI